MSGLPAPSRVHQMRLVVRAHDYDEAVAFYRDVLGAEQVLQQHAPTGERVTILDVGRATLEIADPAQVEHIDQVEVGRPVSPHLRVALEVSDADRVATSLEEAGAALVAPPTVTPWRSLNARFDAPGGVHLTVFQELAAGGEPPRDTPVPTARLSAVLRAVGAGFVAFFGLAFVLVASGVPISGTLAALTRWGHGGEAYELMITAVYTVWGVHLWRAAAAPLRHGSFLDFTLTANVVHFGVMLVQGVVMHGEHLHLAGDVLLGWLAVAAIAATWLPVRRRLTVGPSDRGPEAERKVTPCASP